MLKDVELRIGKHATPDEVFGDILADYPSTHPLKKERIDRLKKQIEILQEKS